MTERQKSRCDNSQYTILLKCSEEMSILPWKDWYIRNSGAEIWLEGADFSKAYLPEAYFGFAHLGMVDFTKANLKKAFLKGANLEQAVLMEAHLENANLSQARLREAYFIGTRLDSANLTEAHLENANLAGAWCKKAIFHEAHLIDARLVEAHLEDADLSGAHLDGANLIEAHLEGADLSGAHLDGANLTEAHLEGANLRGAYLDGAILKNAHIEGANLFGAYLVGADLENSCLKGADLCLANLKGADLLTADLERAQFHEAMLEGAKFHAVNIKGAYFNYSTVDGATIFITKYFDKNTDFTGVALDACRIEPGLKEALKDIIRRNRWKTHLESAKVNLFMEIVWRIFWSFTDYGHSVRRIVYWFSGLVIFFALIYYYWGVLEFEQKPYLDNGCLNANPGIINDLFKNISKERLYNPFYMARALYFSVVTMTTLGFGDMYAKIDSWAGHFLLSVQVLLGYVLLGALITQFAIMFSGEGPPYIISNKKKLRKPLIEIFKQLGRGLVRQWNGCKTWQRILLIILVAYSLIAYLIFGR